MPTPHLLTRVRLLLLALVCLLVPFVAAGCSALPASLGDLERMARMSDGRVVLLVSFATVLSEDLACISAGVLSANGIIGFPLACLGCFLGIIISDTSLFFLGMMFGRRLTRVPPISWWLSERNLQIGQYLFERYGGMLVVTSRFLPGTRIAAYVSAGMLGYPWKRFVPFMFLACSAWTPLLVGFSKSFGGVLLTWFKAYEKWAIFGFALVTVLVWLMVKITLPLFTPEGRQYLAAKARLLTSWVRR